MEKILLILVVFGAVGASFAQSGDDDDSLIWSDHHQKQEDSLKCTSSEREQPVVNCNCGGMLKYSNEEDSKQAEGLLKQGAPGKRGPVGPKGEIGQTGQKGETGNEGACVCDLTEMEANNAALQRNYTNLKISSEAKYTALERKYDALMKTLDTLQDKVFRCTSEDINIVNGSVTCSNEEYTLGTVCNFTCSEGFERLGSDIVTCIESNHGLPHWSGDAPRCLTRKKFLSDLLRGLQQSSIKSQISSFFEYTYDGGNNSIGDGGNDLFDTGNQIYINDDNGNEVFMNYDQEYSETTQALTRTGHPFLAFLWIGDTNNRERYIKVLGNIGADNHGANSNFNGVIEITNFLLKYSVFQVYNAPNSDPAYCEVFYTISNTVLWRSSAPTNVQITGDLSAKDVIDHKVTLPSSTKNTLLGFMLLAKTTGTGSISQSNIEGALGVILQNL